MQEYKELLQLTQTLLDYLDTLSNKYAEVKETGEKGDFYEEVKPFADEVKGINDAWKEEAIKWVKNVGPKNLYNQQIDSAHEHVETVSVQAFFPDTSRSRFNSSIASARYVLNNMIHLLIEKGKPSK
ncbi:YppE family protein [Cytobacillus sp. FJAT-53684]|uniref:YppE family protein n=1 Tax=Cytobacillus mangrovibacter TaxID=3299024 RepID=A0ABW6JV55_9BACI